VCSKVAVNFSKTCITHPSHKNDKIKHSLKQLSTNISNRFECDNEVLRRISGSKGVEQEYGINYLIRSSTILKTYLKETGREAIGYIFLAHNKVEWQDFVNIVNETLGCTQGGAFDYLKNHLHIKDFFSWNYFVIWLTKILKIHVLKIISTGYLSINRQNPTL